MLLCSEFDKVTAAIRAASTSTEARFLDLGSQLGTAVDTIQALTQTFDLLANELKGENLRDATDELSHIMSRVVAFAQAQNNERDALGQLADLTLRIQQRVLQMAKAVDGIGMLAINARIEAVSIGSDGLDFAGFTTVIGHTLHLAQASLKQFTSELGGLGHHLRMAAANQLALSQQQDAASRSVPSRLAASVKAINDQRKRAVAATSAVAQKSRQMGQRINSAVMALQIGDITRQRLEHVDYALGVMADIQALPGRGEPAGAGEWAGLSEPQRQALAVLCCRMQSAQLLDTANEFDHEMAQILRSIQELASDAQEILSLSHEAAGASGNQRGTFLGKVDEQVAEVSALIAGLSTARREADAVAASVTQATTQLVSHTSTLRSLEEDIRIMGLNTTLKCGRLGTTGRPLMVIAQELRSYANQIAIEAGTVTASLDRVVTIASSLSGDEQKKRTADLAAVGDRMAHSVGRLTSAGESLGDALATLSGDTKGVGILLGETAVRANVYEELSRIMRQAAADLARAVADSNDATTLGISEADHMLALFMRSYTMDRERAVHDRHSEGRPSAMAAKVGRSFSTESGSTESGLAQTASAEFEDMLF